MKVECCVKSRHVVRWVRHTLSLDDKNPRISIVAIDSEMLVQFQFLCQGILVFVVTYAT